MSKAFFTVTEAAREWTALSRPAATMHSRRASFSDGARATYTAHIYKPYATARTPLKFIIWSRTGCDQNVCRARAYPTWSQSWRWRHRGSRPGQGGGNGSPLHRLHDLRSRAPVSRQKITMGHSWWSRESQVFEQNRHDVALLRWWCSYVNNIPAFDAGSTGERGYSAR